MHRHELTDSQYARPEVLLPEPDHHGKAGRPWLPHRTVVNGILWILRTGPWLDLPERYGKWNTVYSRFKRWRRGATWTRLYTNLLDERDNQDKIDHNLWCIDGTIARAARCAGGARHRNRRRPRLNEGLATEVEEPQDHALGYSRGGYTTKIHLQCENQGTLEGIHVTPGQRHENKAFEPIMQRVYLPRRRGRGDWWATRVTVTRIWR